MSIIQKALDEKIAEVLANFDELLKQNRLFELVNFFQKNGEFVREKLKKGYSLELIHSTLQLGGVFKNFDFADFQNAFDSVETARIAEEKKAKNKERYKNRAGGKGVKSTPPAENLGGKNVPPAENFSLIEPLNEGQKKNNPVGFSPLEEQKPEIKIPPVPLERKAKVIELCQSAGIIDVKIFPILADALGKFSDVEFTKFIEQWNKIAIPDPVKFKNNLEKILAELDKNEELNAEDYANYLRSVWFQNPIKNYVKICDGHPLLAVEQRKAIKGLNKGEEHSFFVFQNFQV